MPGLLLRLLSLLDEEGPLAPGDAVARLGAPRYRVLSAFHCLEELGLASPVYEKANIKIYQISLAGKELLRQAGAGGLASVIEEALLSAPSGTGEAQASSRT